MKHVFIINPTAGKTDSRQKIYDMAEALRTKHDLDVQCILTKKQGHATEIAQRLCDSGEELRFYACGGDGTANEVANGIIGYKLRDIEGVQSLTQDRLRPSGGRHDPPLLCPRCGP